MMEATKKLLISLRNIIFNLNEKNIEGSTQATMELYENNSFLYSLNLTIIQSIYSAFSSQRREANIYIDYLQNIEKKEKEKENQLNNSNIIQMFSIYLLRLETNESNYLLENLIKRDFIKQDFINNKRTLWFAHLQGIIKIRNLYLKPPYYDKFISNISRLSKGDWSLHKKYITKGINPLKLAKILRYDDFKRLQEISSQTNFDFNQKIEPSLYETYSFINKENVSLVDYAAFFGSIQCFKYLLLNEASIKKTLKYAIAGGNLEIIHLCEQNHSFFDETYETAIEFHRNDIFHYFYENQIIKILDFELLGIKCILHNNFEIFFYLENEGMIINNKIIHKIAKTGNTFLIQYLLEIYLIPFDILISAKISENIELIKLLIPHKGINLNQANIH